MTVAQSTRQLQLYFGSLLLSMTNGNTAITLQASNMWQLIGFTAHLTKSRSQTTGLVFVGTLLYQFKGRGMDLSPASVIRVGGASDSFSGHISYIRIMTPGAAVIKSSKLFEISSSETQ